MFSFSRKKQESTAPSESSPAAPAQAAGPVETELSIPSFLKVPTELRYVYAFHNSDAEPLQPNQLSLSAVDMETKDDKYLFSALIRQTLDKTIQLQEMPILLLGPDNEVLGRKVFDLSKAGAIPPRSSRPWQFLFTADELEIEQGNLPKQWSLAFELQASKPKQSLDLEDSWREALDNKAIDALQKTVAEAPALEDGEVNFMGVQAKFTEQKELAITLLIRNGSEEEVQLKQLSLKVEDASGEVAARGNFSLKKLTVQPHTSKPWTFLFPPSAIVKKNPDLSAWKVYPAGE